MNSRLLGLIVNMGLRSFIHRLTAPAYSTGEGPAGPMKLACVVNQELKMGKGKIAAQVGHASVKAILDLGKSNPAALEAYLSKGQKKICLKVPTSQDLKSLQQECKEAGVPCQQFMMLDILNSRRFVYRSRYWTCRG